MSAGFFNLYFLLLRKFDVKISFSKFLNLENTRDWLFIFLVIILSFKR
jgi:hypothetical protein